MKTPYTVYYNLGFGEASDGFEGFEEAVDFLEEIIEITENYGLDQPYLKNFEGSEYDIKTRTWG